MRTPSRVALLAIISAIAAAGPANAASYTVTSDADSGPGSLRQAILDANAPPSSTDVIIIDAGVTPTFTTVPPQITDAVLLLPAGSGRAAIDLGGQPGLVLQPGASDSLIRDLDIRNTPGTAIDIRNGVVSTLLTDLRVGLTADGTGDAGGEYGIKDSGTETLIRDSVISGSGYGLVLGGSNGEIEGNSIGTNVAGTASVANGNGMYVSGTGYRIGFGGAGNVVAGNIGFGIHLDGAAGTRIQGNRIGVSAAGGALPNGTDGILVFSSSSTIIGSSTGSDGPNVIANNGRNGITVTQGGTGNVAYANSIFTNGGLALSLRADTLIEPNDPGDMDTGSNGLQNHPVITSARSDVVSGTIDSAFGRATTIDVYSDTAIDQPSGHGELRTLRCRTEVAADAKTWTCTPASAIPAGQFASALATTVDGTSEPSASLVVAAVPVKEQPPAQEPAPTTPTPPATLATPAASEVPAVAVAVAAPVLSSTRALLEGWASRAVRSARGRNRRGAATLTIALPAPSGALQVTYRLSGTVRVSARRTVKLPARTTTVRAGRAGRVVYRLRVPRALRSARVSLTARASAGGVAATRTRAAKVTLTRR